MAVRVLGLGEGEIAVEVDIDLAPGASPEEEREGERDGAGFENGRAGSDRGRGAAGGLIRVGSNGSEMDTAAGEIEEVGGFVDERSGGEGGDGAELGEEEKRDREPDHCE
jgi:hypothetical protein